ncbi:MAG: histidinol-phosphatase [Coprobacillaceae bacterium]
MTKTNFHTHTFRCGHAVGNEEAMIQSAIENKIEILGMSCHVPLPKYRWHLLKGMPYAMKNMQAWKSFCKAMVHNGPAMRMPYKMKKKHQINIKKMQEEHKDIITIYQGYEAEYFRNYLSYYQEMLDSKEVEYLILGHHFDKYSVHTKYYGRIGITNAEIEQYKDDVVEAFDTGLFSYLAHPDLFMVGKVHWDEFCDRITREICLKAKETNTPLEINGGGMRRGLRQVDDEMVYPYPNTHFWKIASEIGNDVVIGLDAHSPEDINDNVYDKLWKFANSHNLRVIDTFPFKKGNRR